MLSLWTCLRIGEISLVNARVSLFSVTKVSSLVQQPSRLEPTSFSFRTPTQLLFSQYNEREYFCDRIRLYKRLKHEKQNTVHKNQLITLWSSIRVFIYENVFRRKFIIIILISNFRKISVIDVILKILVKIMYKYLYRRVFNLLSPN